MNYTDQDSTLICAYLVRQGYVKKSEFPNLELDEHLLREVQDRLAQVGLELVFNTYSPFYAVRFMRAVQDTVESSNNLGLKNNEVAMLVILWCKLILPKRLALETQDITLEKADALAPELPNMPSGEIQTTGTSPASVSGSLLHDEPREEKTKEETGPGNERLFVKVNELAAEFGEHFGSKTAFKATLTRLSNLQFVHIHNEIITEGIFLDLLIDGHQMGNEIKKSALAYKMAGLGEEEEAEDLEEEAEEEKEVDVWSEVVKQPDLPPNKDDREEFTE